MNTNPSSEHRCKRVLVSFAALTGWAIVAILSGCGGGGDNSAGLSNPVSTQTTAPPRPSLVRGVFGGELKDEQAYDLLYVVLGTGEKIGFFGTGWSNEFRLVGYWSSNEAASSWTSQDRTI